MKQHILPIIYVVVVGGLLITGWFVSRAQDTDPAASTNDSLQSRPHVVIILLDTLRIRSVSAYGHTRPTTPYLEELRHEACTFTNAYSTSCWTSPAHASLFTGLYPIAHGCTQENWRLGQQHHTLAEKLADSGYHTVGIVENPMLACRHNFDQGFHEYYEVWRLTRERPVAASGATAEVFRQLLAARKPDRPLFTFINLIGPHSPYDSAGPHTNAFVADPGLELEANHWQEHYLGLVDLSPTELAHLRDRYEEEVRAVDAVVRDLVTALRAHELLDDTLLIITSDHGENIGDHNHMDHMFALYQTTVHIPLLVRYPALFPPNTSDSGPVQLTDLMPTILSLAAPDDEITNFQGRSLLIRDDAPRPLLCEYYRPRQVLNALRGHPPERVRSHLQPYNQRVRAIILGDFKLIQAEQGRQELYNLSLDPHEQHDLSANPAYAETRASLANTLSDMLANYGRAAIPTDAAPPDDQEFDEATFEELRSLGYVGE